MAVLDSHRWDDWRRAQLVQTSVRRRQYNNDIMSQINNFPQLATFLQVFKLRAKNYNSYKLSQNHRHEANAQTKFFVRGLQR
jgi:hypothetical protein